jgi:virginiamycin A acetyltransferase
MEAYHTSLEGIQSNENNSQISSRARLYGPYTINNVEVGDYTYIAKNSNILSTKIGKFCSIGPNLFCGWGIHPTGNLSTSPVFYSLGMQAGKTFAKENKITETLPIVIGNDVFIGMNVTILDGVNIGDGAIIGAGAVVSKDIPAYAIAVGSPIRILKYRFEPAVIQKLQQIKWWDFDEKALSNVEKYFSDIDGFVEKYAKD